MSVQRLVLDDGAVRYRARVKSHGREVATRVFPRKRDALAWEQEQTRRLQHGEWIDPRRGRVPLGDVAASWLASRTSYKQRSQDTAEGNWRRYIAPRFASRQVASITAAEVSEWLGTLVGERGLAPATATSALATMRGVLSHAVADERVTRNVAAVVKPPRRRAHREPRALTVEQLRALAVEVGGVEGDVVLFLGLTGLRWSELAGLRVGDVVDVPGFGLRVQRATTAAGGGGRLVTDSVKNNRARTVPLVEELRPIVERVRSGRPAVAPLFAAAEGGVLRESNWRRSARWVASTQAVGVAPLRVHDLRHTAASVWIAAGADVKVVQRVLGHATATMTLDLYGHLMDASLWDAAGVVGQRLGGISGASGPAGPVAPVRPGGSHASDLG